MVLRRAAIATETGLKSFLSWYTHRNIKLMNVEEKRMGLIKCPACKKKVSEAAPTCPNCGEPINSALSSDKVTILCILGVVVIIILAVVAGSVR